MIQHVKRARGHRIRTVRVANLLVSHLSSTIQGVTLLVLTELILIPQISNAIVYIEYFISQEILTILFFLACFERCATCNGPSQNDCVSCNSGFYKYLDTTCVGECPAGTFLDTSSQSCQGNSSLLLLMINYFFIACDTTCQTCSGPLNTNCVSCDTAGQTPFLHNSMCYPPCSDGTYLNATDFKCYRIYRILLFSVV